MEKFEWNIKFETGIDKIDNQHKKIVDFINRLSFAVAHKDTRKNIATILSGCISYVKTHFRHEEEMFDKYNFVRSIEHKRGHKRVLKQLTDFQVLYSQNQSTPDEDLLLFLRGWLTVHILGEDMQYVEVVTQGLAS
jgi:hemerythrin